MTTFWGAELTPDKPCIYEHDGPGELQISGVAFGPKSKGLATLQVSADNGPRYTVCVLKPGERPHEKLDLLFGPGNSRVEFSVAGEKGAQVHLTGYMAFAETFEEYDSADDDEGESDDGEGVGALAGGRRAAGGEEDDEDDEEDEDVEMI